MIANRLGLVVKILKKPSKARTFVNVFPNITEAIEPNGNMGNSNNKRGI